LVSTYIDRGNAYRARGDNDRAIADFTEAIRLDPRAADAYYSRGFAYLYSGSLANALADVSKASELDPSDAYKALWADIVAQRNNAPSHLSQASAKIDMTPWPAPIIRSYLGRMPPEAVLAAADDPDVKNKRARSAKPISTAANWRCGRVRRTRRCACSSWRRAAARETSTNGSPPMRSSRRSVQRLEPA
jgi:lipoprotein NlpI